VGRLDVVEPAEHPEVVSFVPPHRGIVTKPLPQWIRILAERRLERIPVEVGDGHRGSQRAWQPGDMGASVGSSVISEVALRFVLFTVDCRTVCDIL
jgi:hypothetical protein